MAAGKQFALQLINGLAPLRPEDKLYVLAPNTPEYKALAKHPNITMLPLPDSYHRSWVSKMLQMHRVFPKWCSRLKIDRVVSLGNAAFPCQGRPQLVYIQLPQLVYHESAAWKKMDMREFLRNSLMDQYVALHLRYASSYAVQTDVMRARLVARFKLPEARVHVLPNAPLELGDVHPKSLPMPLQPLRLLFLSRYYPHKNFECLPALAAVFQERKIPVEITLTISKDEARGAATVLQALKDFPEFKNIGPVSLQDVGKTVEAHHGVFLPSLMESFSGVYAEALLHRRHIFTSHYDFATELLGEAAFYFDPLKPEHICSVLEAAAKTLPYSAKSCVLWKRPHSRRPRINSIAKSFSRIIDTFA